MEPITGDPELMLKFYQNVLQLIGLVISIAALGSGCLCALVVCTECYSGAQRGVKTSTGVSPEGAWC